jgi:hypothetical protein
MIFQFTIKFIPSLLYSIAFLGVFYWQFIETYSLIINYFTQYRLFVLYGYIFIYLFGVQIVAVSIINLLNNYLIKKASFVVITVMTMLIFYMLSFHDFYRVIDYFIKYPLPYNSIVGIIFFIMLSLGYSLYSIGVLFFKKNIPSLHIFIFFILGCLYSLGFIHFYCKPIL